MLICLYASAFYSFSKSFDCRIATICRRRRFSLESPFCHFFYVF